MWHVTWISISLNHVYFCTHISLPLNQIAGLTSLVPHFFLSHYGSPSFLQVGCSSGTQIRSTLPFGWPFFFTTQALMHLRLLLTWYPTWTTLRQPTALPWPMPVSSTCLLAVYLATEIGCEMVVDDIAYVDGNMFGSDPTSNKNSKQFRLMRVILAAWREQKH